MMTWVWRVINGIVHVKVYVHDLMVGKLVFNLAVFEEVANKQKELGIHATISFFQEVDL